jgi:hypothetical protein
LWGCVAVSAGAKFSFRLTQDIHYVLSDHAADMNGFHRGSWGVNLRPIANRWAARKVSKGRRRDGEVTLIVPQMGHQDH